jgi:DNA helicase HerA-like ATPase
LNADELAVVSAFPIGATGELPVAMIGSRMVAPSDAIPRQGRVVAQASFPGRERPLALSAADSLRHLHVLGPTGSGKSTLLLNLITQDMAAGRAVVVIEPRGDLIADVLERVPPERVNDVVLLNPTDTERAGRPEYAGARWAITGAGGRSGARAVSLALRSALGSENA